MMVTWYFISENGDVVYILHTLRFCTNKFGNPCSISLFIVYAAVSVAVDWAMRYL